MTRAEARAVIDQMDPEEEQDCLECERLLQQHSLVLAAMVMQNVPELASSNPEPLHQSPQARPQTHLASGRHGL